MILEWPTPMDGAQGWSINLDEAMPVFPREFFDAVVLDYALTPGGLSYDYTSVPADERAGHELITTMDTWYYRLHFSPAQLNFGNLSGNQQLRMYLWNAFFTAVDVESFEIVDGPGVTYETDFAVPGLLPALQQAEYTFFVSSDGAPVLDATATWTIDGEIYEVPITGRRAILFPFKPNWKMLYTEILSWKTTISTSYSGKSEQAVRIRDVARRAFQYSLRLFKKDTILFDLLTFGWLGKAFISPIWSEGSTLTTQPQIGDTIIYLDTRYRTFSPGSNVILFKSPTEYELVQIASLTDSSITLELPIQQGLVGTTAYPTLSCFLDGPISTSRQSTQHLDSAVRMVMSPVDGHLRTPVIAPEATYLGEELYTKETNWRDALPISIDPRSLRVDNDLGPISEVQQATFPLITRGFKWLVKDRASGHDLLGFFGRREGRFKPLWIPSGTDDMLLQVPALAGDVTFYVSPTDYGNLVAQHPARRHLLFILRDGQRLARRIESVVTSDNYSLLTIDEPLGTNVTPQSVKRISYLGFYRLGSDDVRFVWHSDTVAEVEVNFVLREPLS